MSHHVLIVDDQRDVSRLLRSALETIEQGLKVSEAPSGEEAILEASRIKVDLLIADYRLPGINGLELMKKFRAINPQGKVIMITGISDPRLLKQVSEADADAFFSKPVSMGDFLDAVERLLGLARTILHTGTTGSLHVQVAPERKSLGELLVNLRADLNAQAVLFLNNMGHIEAEAGQLPDPNNTVSMISALMGMFNAAQRAASIINRTENHFHLFDGENMDGIFLPIGAAHALLVVGKGLAKPRSLPQHLEVLNSTRVKLLETLKSFGVPVEAEEAPAQRSAIDEPFTRPEDLSHEFLDIFDQIGQKTDDANSFWDSAVEKGTTFSEPDKLTYEQASRLGLTPDSAHDQ
jgi:DNA-binding response OmpR family regulator